jgi:hypothetical protein
MSVILAGGSHVSDFTLRPLGRVALPLLFVQGLLSCSLDARAPDVASMDTSDERRDGDEPLPVDMQSGAGSELAAGSPAQGSAGGVPGPDLPASEAPPSEAASAPTALAPTTPAPTPPPAEGAVTSNGLSVEALDPATTGVAFAGLTCQVASGGDINGDGRSDFLVSVDGAAYALFRPDPLVASNLSDIPALVPGIKLELPGDECPTVDVAAGGDVNGDGFGDVIVTSARREIDNRQLEGAVFVVFGGSEPRSVAASLLETGTSDGFAIRGPGVDRLRGAVTGAGDVNRDGLDDVLVSGAEGAFIVYGKRDFASVFLADVALGRGGFGYGLPPNEPFANLDGGVANLGDMNGDGRIDFALGAENGTAINAGKVWVTWGIAEPPASGSVDAAQGFAISGAQMNDRVGQSVANAGDVNGDGLPDILIDGPPRFQTDGSATGPLAYLVFGKTDSVPVNLADLEAGLGGGFIITRVSGASAKVWGAGDVNGDGLDDMLILGNGSYVVFGREGSAPVVAAELNPPSLQGFKLITNGTGAASAGDVNGDGLDDMLFGGRTGLVVVYGPGTALPMQP